MMPERYTFHQRVLIGIIIVFFASIFCSISLVNHYNFRTNAYDLGIYNNMLYSYSHFSINYTPVQQPYVQHAFSDHFEPVFIIFSPLYWLFGSWTLLIIQIFLVIAGGIGAMRYMQLYSHSNSLSIATLLHFYGIWGVYSALAFDFHNNVTAAMLVPWLLFFVHQQKWKPVIVVWLLMILSKENMALYTIFVCLGIAIHYSNQKVIRKKMLILSGLASVYFVLVLKVVIPFFGTDGQGYVYDAMYKSVGTTPSAILNNVLTKPGYLFSLLFENLDDPYYKGIKSELHFCMLMSGGILLLRKPQFLIMLIPIYAQKLFCSDPGKWGINYHYSIEFVPVIAIGSAVFFTSFHQGRWKSLPFILAFATMFLTKSKIDDRVSTWHDKISTMFYHEAHYKTDFDATSLRQELNDLKLPANASVSAQNVLVPRLSDRDKIYLFPVVQDAQYIILAPTTDHYPLNESYQPKLDSLRQSSYWDLIQEGKVLVVFKRK